MSCISEILKLKGDKEVFIPDGDWIAVEGGGTYKDHEYLIVLNTNGHRCGYVAIPPEHPYSKIPLEHREFLGGKREHYDYNSLDINCHGGLTFMAPDHGLKDLLSIPCSDMWIGFDCGHHEDLCDVDAHERYFGTEKNKKKESFFRAMNYEYNGQTLKNYHYTEQECHSIIDQLIEVAA